MSWEKYELKHLCTEIIDCVNKTAPISPIPTEYKMLRTSDIRNGRVNLDNLNCVSYETFEKWTRRGKLQAGDIIFTREAPLGEVGLVKNPDNYFLGQRLVLFRANTQVCDNRFLLYALMYHDNKQAIIGKGVGSTVLHLRVPECEKITIKAPKLPTQHRIADILSAYDDLIENNRKQIKLLEEAAQRLYKEWFIDLRFPGHEHTKIVDGVPEGWRRLPVAQLGEFLNGFAFKPSDWQETGMPIIKIKEMGNGVSSDTPRNNGERVPEKYHIKAGDILFSWSATLSVMIWNGEDGWLNQHLFKVTPKPEISKEFLLQSLAQTIIEFSNLTTGATMKHIQRNKLEQVFVVVPPSEIMAKYQKIADPIRSALLLLAKQIDNLSEARDRLLPKLMSEEMEV